MRYWPVLVAALVCWAICSCYGAHWLGLTAVLAGAIFALAGPARKEDDGQVVPWEGEK